LPFFDDECFFSDDTAGPSENRWGLPPSLLGTEAALGSAWGMSSGSEGDVAVRDALEVIFAPENLAQDGYLRSHMTSQLFVPIKALSQCRMLVGLEADEALIAEAARSSEKLLFDPSGSMLRPRVAAQRRNTLLLRDLPEGTNESDILSVFEGVKGCPQPKEEARAESAGSWVVTFESESSCLTALEHVRGRDCNGSPLKARVRGEDLLRTLPALAPASEASGACGGRASPPQVAAPDEVDQRAALSNPDESTGSVGIAASAPEGGNGTVAKAANLAASTEGCERIEGGEMTSASTAPAQAGVATDADAEPPLRKVQSEPAPEQNTDPTWFAPSSPAGSWVFHPAPSAYCPSSPSYGCGPSTFYGWVPSYELDDHGNVRQATQYCDEHGNMMAAGHWFPVQHAGEYPEGHSQPYEGAAGGRGHRDGLRQKGSGGGKKYPRAPSSYHQSGAQAPRGSFSLPPKHQRSSSDSSDRATNKYDMQNAPHQTRVHRPRSPKIEPACLRANGRGGRDARAHSLLLCVQKMHACFACTPKLALQACP
jgi:hypothetical protein